MTSDTCTDGTELVEIVEDDAQARKYWKRALNDDRPETPKVTVSADLFAELVAYAGRGNWVASTTTMQEARDVLRSIDTGTEQ